MDTKKSTSPEQSGAFPKSEKQKKVSFNPQIHKSSSPKSIIERVFDIISPDSKSPNETREVENQDDGKEAKISPRESSISSQNMDGAQNIVANVTTKAKGNVAEKKVDETGTNLNVEDKGYPKTKSYDEKQLPSRFTQQLTEGVKTTSSDTSGTKSDDSLVKKAMKSLLRLGFKEKESETKKEDDTDPKDRPLTSKEIFEKTLEEFPQAKVSGSKISTSYILPKPHKIITEDVKSDDGPIVLRQSFSEEDDKEMEPLSKSTQNLLKKSVIMSGISLDDETEYQGGTKPSEILRYKSSQSKSQKPSEEPVVDAELIEEVSEKKEFDQHMYGRYSSLLPELSSEGKLVHGTQREYTATELDIGEKGFIAQLLMDAMNTQLLMNVAKDHESKFSRQEPIHKKNNEERKAVIDEVNAEIKAYFSRPEKLTAKSKMLKAVATIKNFQKMQQPSATVKNLKSKDELPTAVMEAPSSSSPSPQPDKVKSPSLMYHTTEWRPGSLVEPEIEASVQFYQRKQSWVGPYIVGTDYWTKVEPTAKEPEKISFGIDTQQKAWYDVHTSDSISKMAGKKPPKITRKKIEAMVENLPKIEVTEVGYQKQGIYSDTESGGGLHPNWNDDLKDMFNEFAKSDQFDKSKTRISLTTTQRMLEMEGILDYRDLTVIQTGLCFIASGGSSYQGLTFDEFKTFLRYIADTKKMPFLDIIGRLKLAHIGISLSRDNI